MADNIVIPEIIQLLCPEQTPLYELPVLQTEEIHTAVYLVIVRTLHRHFVVFIIKTKWSRICGQQV